MRYLVLIILFCSFTPYERKPTNDDECLNKLMQKVRCKAMEGTLDKERIKQWLSQHESLG